MSVTNDKMKFAEKFISTEKRADLLKSSFQS